MVALGVASGVHWALGIPPVTQLPGWFYGVAERALHPTPWAGPLLGLSLLGLGGALRFEAKRRSFALGLAFVGALCVQLYAAHLHGPGWHTFSERQRQGHGEFIHTVVAHRGDLDEVLPRYEALQVGRQLGAFAPSKPPGILWLYARMDDLGRQGWFRAAAAPMIAQFREEPYLADEEVASAAAAVSLVFPVGYALVVFPLYLLGLALTGRGEVAMAAVVIGATVPNVAVINGHTDSGVFPLLITGGAALAAWGMRTGKTRYAGLGAAVIAFGSWISFSVAPGGAYGTVAAVAAFFTGVPDAQKRLLLVRGVAAALLGAALVLLALEALDWLGDPVLRFRNAMAYHRAWKGGMLGGRYALVGLAEYAVYVGAPVLVFYFGAHVPGRRLAAPEALFLWGVSALIALQALSSGAVEVARTWLFLSPFLALGAAIGIRRAMGYVGTPTGAFAMVVVHLAIIPIMRAHQIF